MSTSFGFEPNVNVGDIVKFGRYPQGANGEIQPLEWRVLETDGDTALLLTEKCVDCRPYNGEDKVGKLGGNTWEYSDLRSWINGEFLDTAFDSKERGRIVVSHNANADNPIWETKGGNRTDDRIFCLSIEEAEKYFKQTFTSVQDIERYFDSDEEWENILERQREILSEEKYALYMRLFQSNADRRAGATEYAESSELWMSDAHHSCLWWLRSSGVNAGCAAFVYYDGGIGASGVPVYDSSIAVRPACRVFYAGC